jgi:hypothetical protein
MFRVSSHAQDKNIKFIVTFKIIRAKNEKLAVKEIQFFSAS